MIPRIGSSIGRSLLARLGRSDSRVTADLQGQSREMRFSHAAPLSAVPNVGTLRSLSVYFLKNVEKIIVVIRWRSAGPCVYAHDIHPESLMTETNSHDSIDLGYLSGRCRCVPSSHPCPRNRAPCSTTSPRRTLTGLSPARTFTIALALDASASFLRSCLSPVSFLVRRACFNVVRVVQLNTPSISARRWMFCPVDTSDFQGPSVDARGREVRSAHLAHLDSYRHTCPSLGVSLSVFASSLSVMFWSAYSSFCESPPIPCP